MVWPAWSGAELLARSEGGSSQQLPELSSDWECTVCSGSLDMTTCMTKHTPLVTTIDDAFPFVCERRVHFLLGAMQGVAGGLDVAGTQNPLGVGASNAIGRRVPGFGSVTSFPPSPCLRRGSRVFPCPALFWPLLCFVGTLVAVLWRVLFLIGVYDDEHFAVPSGPVSSVSAARAPEL